MKKVAMIPSIALLALGAAAIQAQTNASRPAAQPTAEKPEKPDEADAAAMLAVVPGAITSESLAAATRNAKDSAAASRELARQLSSSPEVQERVRARFRAGLPTQHPDIEEILSLSSKDVNRLFDLLARQNDELRSAPDAKARAQRLQAHETELASMLGKKYERWRDYKAGLPLRLQVRDLGAALIADDIPLADARVEPLIAALVAAQKQISQNGGLSAPERDLKLLDAASTHLSPQQLEVYRKVLERQANRARALTQADQPGSQNGTAAEPSKD